MLYDRLVDYLETYDQRANPIGLFRHKSKGKLLLPPSAPDPPGLRILQHTKAVRTCAVLAGASIGRAEDVEDASLVKVSAMNPLMETIVPFGLVEPQAALRTLADCANHKMGGHAAQHDHQGCRPVRPLIKETKARLMQLPGY